jgi:hypothetical protein
VQFAGAQFNFAIERDGEDEHARLDFNHHFQVSNGGEAVRALRGAILEKRNLSRTFLDNVYTRNSG